MADMANILLQDDSDVTKTLIPISNADRSLLWREDAEDLADAGQTRLSANWEKLKDGGWRLTAKLEVPVMETIGTAAASGYVAPAKVAYVVVGIFTMFSPARCTSTDRANMYRMMVQLLQGAGTSADAGLHAGTAAADAFLDASSAMPVPYGFIHLAMPN